jgi:hypothetical protein
MAQIKHLPIYRVSYNLLDEVVKATSDFPKRFKYNLGTKLCDECAELVVFVYKANSNKKKSFFIEQILERMQVLELILRLCKDLRLLTVKQFSEIVTLTDNIARQAQGWLKFSHGLKAEQ